MSPWKNNFADLHLHTYFSDGTYSPAQLVGAAKKAGLACVAVVDHDTVLGIEPTLEAAEDIEVLPGIEFSAAYQGLEIHILGYLIDYRNKALTEKLQHVKQNRIERVYKMLDKLNGLGVKLKAQGIFDSAKFGTVGRLHVARAMLKERIVNSVGEAFFKYIGENGPGYVLGFRLAPPEAIELIKNAGGIPVLAHPYTLNNDELVSKLVGFGIMGLEAYYPEHSGSMRKFYLELARKYNLLVTGGSDCHGDARPEVKIGSVKIPYELVEKIKLAKEKLIL